MGIPGQLPRYRQLHFPDHRDLPDKSREGVSPIGHTILLLLLMVFIAAGAFFAIRLLNGTYLGKPVKAFQASEVFTSSLAGKENMKARPFAQKLCVSSKGSVDCIKNASLEEGQKGLLFNLSNIRYCMPMESMTKSILPALQKS